MAHEIVWCQSLWQEADKEILDNPGLADNI